MKNFILNLILIILGISIGYFIVDLADKRTEKIMQIGDCVHELNGHDGKMDYQQAWSVYYEQCAERN